MKKLFCFLLLVLSSSLLAVKAQERQTIDSLQKKLESSKKDSTQAILFYRLYNSFKISDYDTAINYARKCLTLSQSIGYKKGIADGYSGIADINCKRGAYQPALENLQKALPLYVEIGDKLGIANVYTAMGNNYISQGNHSEALDNYLKGLKMFEEMGDKPDIARSYCNIGTIYQNQGNFTEALKDYQKTLSLSEESGYKNGIAVATESIGAVYQAQSNFSEALKDYLKAITYYNEIGDNGGIARSYNTIGAIYTDEGNYAEALNYYLNAIKIFEETKSKPGLCEGYTGIGVTYEKEGNLTDALKYETEGLSLALDIQAKDIAQKTYGNLAEINTKLKNYKDAYEDERLCKLYRDTVFSNQTEQKLAGLQMQNNFDKKQDSLKTEQVKKDITAKKEIQNQKNIKNFFLSGLLLVLAFAGFIFRSLQISRRQKIIIEKEKQANDELLLNILPAEVADELKATGGAKAKSFETVTVMFTDFKDFTKISEKLSPAELVTELHYLFQAFDNIIHNHNTEKIKTIGDSYMAAGGLPVPNQTNAKDVVNAAIEIQQFMLKHNKQREAENKPVFEARIGINTGPVVAGIVGVKKFAYDIWGDTVNLASRMESSGEPGKVNISGSTYQLVKNDFTCTHRGQIHAKNKGEVDMYFVESTSS